MRSKAISPTEEETTLVSQILKHAKCHNGLLSADAAVDVFGRSGLSHVVLGEIWTLADEDQNGRLSENEVVVAIRLMGWVQNDKPLSESLLENPGPLPFLEGISTPASLKASESSSSSQFPPIRSPDIRTFHDTFHNSGPIHGFLEGEIVRDIFMRSNLAYSDLSLIWTLVDTTERGSLDFREFAMGMYLIESLKSCQLSSVPASIPHHLYEQIDTIDLPRPKPSLPFPSTKESMSRFSNRSPDPPPAPRPIASKYPPKPPPLKANGLNQAWAIPSFEKADYDQQFNVLDSEGMGFIRDYDAEKFLMKYRLPVEELAHIWDLAAVRREKGLNQDEFAVAMHLIQDRLKGKEIPWELPPSLVPPSLRSLESPVLPPYQSSTQADAPKLKGEVVQSPITPGSPESSRRRMARSVTSASSSRSPMLESPGPPQSARSSSSTSLSLGFLTNAPSKLSNTPHLSRRRTSAVQLSMSEEDPLEELKTETKNLRLQIEGLLRQLSSQNDYRATSESLRQENDQLQAKVVDLETSMSQILNQMQNNSNILSEEAAREIKQLSRRVAELEQTEAQLQQTSSDLEVVKKDNEKLTAQTRELRNAQALHKSDLDDAQHAMEELERENASLKTRLADMQKAFSQPDSANAARELRVLLSDVTQENQRLKERVREMEGSMEQMLLSGKNHTQHDEVLRENRELKLQVQELELLAAQLQSTNDDNHLQRVLLAVTRDNEGMKARIREMQSSSAQMRSAHDAQVVDLQRRLDELAGENNRLKSEFQSTSRGQESVDDSHMPPPAYDDTFIES